MKPEQPLMLKGAACPRCGYYLFVREEVQRGSDGVTMLYRCAKRGCPYSVRTITKQTDS